MWEHQVASIHLRFLMAFEICHKTVHKIEEGGSGCEVIYAKAYPSPECDYRPLEHPEHSIFIESLTCDPSKAGRYRDCGKLPTTRNRW